MNVNSALPNVDKIERFVIENYDPDSERPRILALRIHQWLKDLLTEPPPHIAVLGCDEKGSILWPHTCPVCNGKGTVPNFFYMPPGATWTDTGTSTAPEQCRTCEGTGIVWG